MKDPNDLGCFCEHVLGKFGNLSDATEDDLAEEFGRVYLKGLPLTLYNLRSVAERCGIRLYGTDSMPANLRGFHDVYGKNKNIYYRNGDSLSGIQNTILHEIREMMETLFGEVNPGYEPLRTNARHIRANQFASAVLLPKERFKQSIYKTGLDIVALSKMYVKSCSQVLLRMGEVLKEEIFSYMALYEPLGENGSKWKVGYWTTTHNESDPDGNVHGLSGFFPRKGRAANPGSLVEMTVNRVKPHLARITMLDHQADPSLVAITRPVLKNNMKLAGISLLVLISADRSLLEAQIEKVKPVTVGSLHRRL